MEEMVPKIYKFIREEVERECTLINNRVSWLLASQAFLFAALALLFTTKTEDLAPGAIKAIEYLRIFIPAISIVITLLGFVGVIGATRALLILRSKLIKKNLDETLIFKSKATDRLGLAPSCGICLCLLLGWIAILVFLLI